MIALCGGVALAVAAVIVGRYLRGRCLCKCKSGVAAGGMILYLRCNYLLPEVIRCL